MTQKIIRQGDLGFCQISQEKFKELLGNNNLAEATSEILAYGETTGHKHTLVAEKQKMQMFKLDNGMVLFKVVSDNAVEVEHDTHQNIKFDAGYYLFDNQFEYDELEEIKKVQD